jgi:hypothetical protein
MLMSLVEADIHSHCKNDFIKKDEKKYITKKTISFSKTGNKILDSENELDIFKQNQTIKVFGSECNDFIFKILSISDNGSYMVVDSSNEIEDEDAGDEIKIYKLTYPKELKLIFSQMIRYKLSQGNLKDVTSEGLDDYSVSYETKTGGYPSSIIKSLNKFSMFYKKEW